MSKRTLLIIAILLRRLERKKRNKNRKKIFPEETWRISPFKTVFHIEKTEETVAP